MAGLWLWFALIGRFGSSVTFSILEGPDQPGENVLRKDFLTVIVTILMSISAAVEAEKVADGFDKIAVAIPEIWRFFFLASFLKNVSMYYIKMIFGGGKRYGID